MNSPNNRRGAERIRLSLDVKFLLRGQYESTGVLLDISENGLALLTDAKACEGDEIVMYPVGLGRLTGKIARTFEGGLGIAFTLSKLQRDSIKERIASLIDGTPYMRLTEDRQSLRLHMGIETEAFMHGETTPVLCTIINMSRTGCLVKCGAMPAIGSKIMIGALFGRVRRLESDGFAVEFERINSQAVAYQKPTARAA
jgi:hypothetical protein